MGATEFTAARIGSRHLMPFLVMCLAAVAMAGEGDPSDADGDGDAEYLVMK